MNKKIKLDIIQHIESSRRFEMSMDDYVAFVSYAKEEDMLFLTHAEVPYQWRGQGIGEKLVLAVFHHITSNNLKATAICPFIKKVLREHPSWSTIIS